MSRTSMPARAISVLLACVLTCTLIPTTSIAFAATADEGTATEQAADNAAADQSASQSEEAQGGAAATDRVNETVPVVSQKGEGDNGNGNDAAAGAADEEAEGAAAGQSGAEASEDDIVMLTASVDLAAASTVLTSNGLTYAVNEGGESVTLMGWAGAAPAGTLNIPTQITVGSSTYKVTNISSIYNLGGGVRAS